MTTNRQDNDPKDTDAGATVPGQRQGNAAKEEAVAASPLEAAPESQTDGQGTSFYNAALTGSGTILPDGTYGAPLPDPNLAARRELGTEAEEVEVEPNILTRAPQRATVTDTGETGETAPKPPTQQNPKQRNTPRNQ